MLPYLQIGPVRLWTYGLMLACGMWVGYYAFRDELKRRNLRVNPDLLMLVIAVAGIVGAKLYHVIVTVIWTQHSALSPHEFFDFAGLAWNGGLIAGFATFAWFAHARRVSLLSLLDAASPAAAIGYAFGRLGCFLAGDGDYGKPTKLPWGMSFPHGLVPTTQRVHPTPLYEIAGAVFLFLILRSIAKRDFLPGIVFGVYLVGSGIFRFAVEFIRINPPVLLGLTEAQVISVISVFVGTVLLIRSRVSSLVPAH